LLQGRELQEVVSGATVRKVAPHSLLLVAVCSVGGALFATQDASVSSHFLNSFVFFSLRQVRGAFGEA
jgi:hypothetical protein